MDKPKQPDLLISYRSYSLSLEKVRIVMNQNEPKAPKICQYLSMAGGG